MTRSHVLIQILRDIFQIISQTSVCYCRVRKYQINYFTFFNLFYGCSIESLKTNMRILISKGISLDSVSL